MVGELKRFALAFCAGIIALAAAWLLTILWFHRLAHSRMPDYQGVVTIDIVSVFCRPSVFAVGLVVFAIAFWMVARRGLSR